MSYTSVLDVHWSSSFSFTCNPLLKQWVCFLTHVFGCHLVQNCPPQLSFVVRMIDWQPLYIQATWFKTMLYKFISRIDRLRFLKLAFWNGEMYLLFWTSIIFNFCWLVKLAPFSCLGIPTNFSFLRECCSDELSVFVGI